MNVKTPLFLFLLCATFTAKSQTSTFNSIQKDIINLGNVENGNEDFTDYVALNNLLADVEIVLLGEQSHGEATTYATKIKLVKYLHEELGFDLIVFESGFFEGRKAWDLIDSEEAETRIALGKSIFGVWSATKEFAPFTSYLNEQRSKGTPLKTLGFDSQFTGRYGQEHFTADLALFLSSIDSTATSNAQWNHLRQSIEYTTSGAFKNLAKNEVEANLYYLDELILLIENASSTEISHFWQQALKNLKVELSDKGLKTDDRDQQMAANLAWIKAHHPNSKIICWGATSHFIHNSETVKMKSPLVKLLVGNYYRKHPMMGHYVKEMYGVKVFTIGFTTYEGEFGLLKTSKIKRPKKNTVEELLGQSGFNNFLLPLENVNFEGLHSRPLGHYYMKNPINGIMDAVVFNRVMEPLHMDKALILEIVPNHEHLQTNEEK